MKRFASSVQQITGQALDVTAKDQGHGSSIEEELEALRAKVADLSDEVGHSSVRILVMC